MLGVNRKLGLSAFMCVSRKEHSFASRHPNYVQIFTDGSRVDEKVATAAVSSVAPNSPDSLSALQALGKLKTDHALLIQIQELLRKINADQKGIVLCGFLDMLVFEETRLLIELRKKLLTKKQQTNSRSHAFFGPKTFDC